MIRSDKLTIKAQEALQSAQEIAQKLNHQEIDSEHRLSALIQQPDGLVRPLLDKLGLNPDSILSQLDDELNRRPQVHGETETHLSKSLRQHFRPEFLNRVDESIVFHRLNREELKQIVEIQLAHVVKRLADQRIALVVTDAAKEVLAREGYDPVFGARSLKRIIQKKLLDALSLQILEGNFKEGDKIEAAIDKKGGDQLIFRKA